MYNDRICSDFVFKFWTFLLFYIVSIEDDIIPSETVSTFPAEGSFTQTGTYTLPN